jgi:hypothetical protein
MSQTEDRGEFVVQPKLGAGYPLIETDNRGRTAFLTTWEVERSLRERRSLEAGTIVSGRIVTPIAKGVGLQIADITIISEPLVQAAE